MAKSVLGGHAYVVHENSDGGWAVRKVPKNGEQPADPYFVSEDFTCNCMAGQHGRECKHSRMAEETLSGPTFTRQDAEAKMGAFFKKVRTEFPDARVRSLIRYQPEDEITLGLGIVGGVLYDQEDLDKCHIWTEAKGLLVRISAYKSMKDYRKAMRAYREED